MSTFTSLIRRAPKRVSALVAIIAAAIIVPAAVFAWGPDRKVYTMENPAQEVTFNSITNNPDVGDERNFVRIKEATPGTTYTDNATLEPGKVYEMMVYYHNNAATRLNESGVGIAHGATVRMELPATVKAGVNAALAGNISAVNANPKTVWDEAYGKNATNADIALRYLDGSAKFTSNGAVNGQTLPDSLFTTGANLGFDSQNGELPGCNEFAGYVTFKFRVDQPNFEMKKEVSTDGKTWKDDTTDAQPGATVQYRISYKNTGTTQQDNVSVRDTLPAGVTYVPGSTLIANSVTGGKYKSTVDGITTTGYNAGSYQPQGDVYFKFSAKLPEVAALKCGTNSIVNTARVTTTGGYKEDDAEVKIPKECKPEAKYVCKSLSVQNITDTSFKFTTDYSVENATFNNVTYIIRDANGTEIDRKTSTAKTLDYTRAIAGKYTVEAVINVTVDGQAKSVSAPDCKKPFEVPAKPVAAYTCDSLAVTRLDRTKFRFTTNYSVQNASFKSVTYIIRDANGTEIDRVNDAAATVEYTRSAVGTYSVQAVISFTVDGQTKTVTDPKCKQPFDVPAQPEYCPIPGKEHLPKDSPDCVKTPETPVVPPELPHTGVSDNIVAFLGLGSLIASIGYYVASRRALS